MNSKINEIIKTYLENDNVDYALLLNGPWGCGKTYYITNELKNIIEAHDYQFIYSSLNGAIDFNQIKRKITYQLLYRLNGKPIADVDFVDSIFEISSYLPKVGSIVSVLEKAKNMFESNKLKNIDISQFFFVFDDLERISTKASRNDFMGLIYENYVKKGSKTLFVTDESNIDDEVYYRTKEKIIRRTISFEPIFSQQIELFIKNNYKTSIKIEYLTENITTFIEYLNLLEIRNIRTISFIFDNFLEVIEKLDKAIIKKHGDFLFRNIMILTQEFKIGNITSEDIDDKKNLNQITRSPFFWKLHEKKEEEKTFEEKFYEKYNKKYSLNYVFVNELFDFILTGYIDIKKLIKEIGDLFDESKPKEELAIDHLIDFRTSEEEELTTACDELITYLKDGYYHLSRLPYLYTLLKFHEERGYISSWKYDVEGIITQAFIESSKKSSNIPNEINFLLGLHPFDERQTKTEYYKELIERIKAKSAEQKLFEKKHKIDKIFNLAKENDYEIWTYLREYRHSEFFKDIVETKSLHYFLELSNSGLYYFESFLYSDILNISNAGEYGYPQKASLDELKQYLLKNIDAEGLQHMRKIRLKEFIEMLEKASNHLENTKR